MKSISRLVRLPALLLCLILLVTSLCSFAQTKQSAANQVVAEAETFRKQGAAGYQQAIEKYAMAAKLYQAEGKKGEEAVSLYEAGSLASSLGRLQEALAYYQQSSLLFRLVEDRRNEAITLSRMGATYAALEEPQKALGYYEQSLHLRRAIDDRAGQAKTLNNLGFLSDALGNKQKAIEYYSQALPLFRAIDDRSGEGRTLHNLGSVYNSLGEREEALEHYNQALVLTQAAEDHSGEAATLTSLSALYTELKEYQKAMSSLNQSLPLYRALGDRSGEAAVFSNLSALYFSLGEREKAAEYYEQSLWLFRMMKDRNSEATSLNNLGLVYKALGKTEKALEYYGQALPLYRVLGNRSGEAATLSNLSAVWYDLRQSRGSIAFLKLSVNLLQQLRGTNRVLDIEAQRAFLQSNGGDYAFLPSWLLKQGRLAEALQVLHFARDQEFFDHVIQRGTPIAPSTKFIEITLPESVLMERMEAALNRITSISRQLAQLQGQINSRQPSAEGTSQLKSLNVSLDVEVATFQKMLPQLVADLEATPAAENRLPTTYDLTELQQTLRTLQQRTGNKAAAIYALIMAEECHLLLVTADNITSASPKIEFATLNRKLQMMLLCLQNDRYDPQIPGKELYDVLFKPIEPEVQKSGATVLLWSLDRTLRLVPMAALWDGQQYLAERFQHVVFTRPTPERMLRDVSRTWTGQGFGTSKAYENFLPLPGVGRELELVFGHPKTRGVLNGAVLQDEAFTKQALLTALQQRKPLVHIASHFKFTPGDDAGSFLLLGNGEHLTLAEMKQTPDLFAGVELLTLAACNTATQKADDKFGREIDGFAEVAQRLGAGAVLASLWEVSDASTPELMAEFYRLRQSGNGMTKAAALQKAQLALLRREGIGAVVAKRRRTSKRVGDTGEDKNAPLFKPDAKHPVHPYYWAPFVLIGNWR